MGFNSGFKGLNKISIGFVFLIKQRKEKKPLFIAIMLY